MEIKKNDSITIDKWTDLEACSPTASYFQTKKCFDFYNSLTCIQGFAIAVENNGQLKALICGYIIADGGKLKQLFSKRAIVPGGVMLHPNCTQNELAHLLAATCNELKSKAIYTEIRNYVDFSAYKNIFEQNGFAYNAHLNFHIETTNTELTLKKLSSTKRRDIKLSLKEGATITDSRNQKDMDEYYKLLNSLYKNKIKTPLFPKSFFDQILQHHDAHLFAIHFKGQLIGGSLCVSLSSKILYEWFVCGLDGEIKNVFPSTLATWAAIEYAAKNSFERFDMMGAGKPAEGYGVRDFKAKFGGELVENGRFLHINNKTLFNLGSWFINYLKKTKTVISLPDKKPNNNICIESNIENINRQEWREFVLNHPNGNIFQTPEIYDIVSDTPKMQPIISVVKENGKIIGCLLIQIQKQYDGFLGKLSARAIITGGPLVVNNNEKTAKLLLNELNNLVRSKVIYTQFRNQFDILKLNEVFQTEKFHFESHLNILIDLSKNKEILWKEVSEGRRKKISTALKFGFIVDVFENDISENLIAVCYKIIEQIYKNAELPLSDVRIIQNAAKANQLLLITLKHEGAIIGCRFILKYNTYLYGWYAGSYQKYYQNFPNDLLIWETIKWGCENDYKTFDYGGAGNPNIKYGVRNFKLQSGGNLVNYGRYEKRYKPISYLIAKMGFVFWRLIKRTNKIQQS